MKIDNSDTQASAVAVFSELVPGTLPDEIQVVPLGRFIYSNPQFTKGQAVEWNITPDDVRAMISTKDRTDVVIDYEHQTLGEGPAPAAGWITELMDRGARGLVARVKWTAKAAQMIRDGAYRYISPVILRGTPSKIEPGKTLSAYLHSVAITNRPFLPTIEPMVAKAFPAGICVATQSGLALPLSALNADELAICGKVGVSPADFARVKAEQLANDALHATQSGQASSLAALTSEELTVCRMTGVSPGNFAATKAKLLAESVMVGAR